MHACNLGQVVHSEPNAEMEGSELRAYHFTIDTPEAVKFVNRIQTLVILALSLIHPPDAQSHSADPQSINPKPPQSGLNSKL